MPNGKPGDHPYTDIVVHKQTIFGSGIDELVREISNMPGFQEFRNQVGELLMKHDPAWNQDSDLELVKCTLLEVRTKLQGTDAT